MSGAITTLMVILGLIVSFAAFLVLGTATIMLLSVGWLAIRALVAIARYWMKYYGE